jgi:hypothetical protein
MPPQRCQFANRLHAPVQHLCGLQQVRGHRLIQHRRMQVAQRKPLRLPRVHLAGQRGIAGHARFHGGVAQRVEPAVHVRVQLGIVGKRDVRVHHRCSIT